MRLKQKLVATLAGMLILLQGFPAFAVSEESMLESEITTIERDSPVSSDDQINPPDALPAQGDSLTQEPTVPPDVDGAAEPLPSEPALISQEDSTPAFTADLVTQGEHQGLYVTLKNAPPELSMIRVQYSYGGLDYIESDGKLWEIPEDLVAKNGDLTLFCYGMDEYPLAAFISGGVNSLYINMLYNTTDSFESIELDPIRFSHENTYTIPEEPPFSADFKMEGGSYTVIGHFRDFAPNVARVRTEYSWDGIAYSYSDPKWPRSWLLKDLGNDDSAALQRLENQEIASRYEEPLQSFVSREQDSFYIRLEITTDSNEVYFSQSAYISRGERQPLPENLTPRVSLGFDLAVSEARNDNGNAEDDEDYYPDLVTYTHGQYQLSVRDNATPAEIMALLPDTVPIRVRLWDKGTKEKYAFGDLACPVVWRMPPTLTLTPGVPLVLEDMAEPLLIPEGTDVPTALGTFTLRKPLTFKSLYDSDAIDLVLMPIAAGDEPNVAIQAYNLDLVDENGEDLNDVRIEDPLSLAFWHKPSGATSIKATAIVGGVRTELFDLLERRDIHHNQSHALYGYIDLLQADEYPYQAYLSGDVAEFTIELAIEGGVYGGKQVTLPWPMEYDAPVEIFDPYDIDGNENNAGSSFEEIEEDNGGQRPDLPHEPESELPPITTPPSDGGAPSDDGAPDPPALTPPAAITPMPPLELLPEPPLELLPEPPFELLPDPQPDNSTAAGLFGDSAGNETMDVPPPPESSQPNQDAPGLTAPTGSIADDVMPDQPALPEPATPQTEEPVSPIPPNDRTDEDSRQQPDREVEARENNPSLTLAATAAIALVGGGIAVAVGVSTASGAATGGGFANKILSALRRLFFKG